MTLANIVNKGKSKWTITCPSAGKAGMGFAVDELRKYIRQISGCELASAEYTAKGPAIVVALREDLNATDQAALPKAAEGYDGYSVAVGDDRIIIAGENGRASIYGVYDLLEQIGCRWFYPTHDSKDPEVVPQASTIKLEPRKTSMASPIPYRIYNGSAWFFDLDPVLANAQTDHALKCRYNMMGWQCSQKPSPLEQYQGMVESGIMAELEKRDMWLHGPGHSFNLFLPNDYFNEHPEWFGLRDGKRQLQVYGGSQYCWANAEARKAMIDNVEKFVLSIPQLKIICTLGFDGGKCCECDDCKKSTPADQVIVMMNELYDRLKASAPHVLVETSGGYHPVHEPPTKVEPRPGLRIVWAHWGRNHEMGYDDPRYGWLNNLETWRKFTNNSFTLCQYYADNFASPWVAAPYIIAMESDRRYLLKHKIDGWYMLIYPKGYWWNHSVNVYLGGVGFYDVKSDFYVKLRDYALTYFGPKAGQFLAPYFEQWAREIRLPYRVKDFATDYDREVFAAQRKVWVDPAVKAVKNDPVYAYRVGKVEKLHTFSEKAAALWKIQQQVRDARVAGDFGVALATLEQAKAASENLISWLNDLADLNQGLVDKNEIPGFLGRKVKDWIPEEQKKIEEGAKEAEKEEIREASSMDMLPAEVIQQQQTSAN